ncbi:MAG: alpha-galactosidase [Eubacteriales bacterium]|jgi:hypothetical protein
MTLSQCLDRLCVGILSLRPFISVDGVEHAPCTSGFENFRDSAVLRCTYDGFRDDFYFTFRDNAIVCRRVTENTGARANINHIGFRLDGLTFGGEPSRDYFYHNENPRIYGRLTFPLDYNRTAADAPDSDFDVAAGNRWADPGVISEFIGRSPYQPFPSILLSNYESACGIVHGTLSQRVFYHNYLVGHADARAFLTVFSSFKDIAALTWEPGRVLIDEWYLGYTGEAADFERIFSGYTKVLREKLPPLYGATDINRTSLVWGSWNDGISRNISEDMLLREAAFLKEHFPTVRWIQVDDGYAVNTPPAHGLGMPYERDGVDQKKFPHGLKHFTDAVRALGLRPAVWIGGFCPKYTPIFKEHPEWFIDYDYRVDSSAPLDVSIPEVRDYMTHALDFFFHQSGFEGLKLDFWSYAFEDSHDLLKNKDASGYEWRDWWLKEIRKRLPGDAYMQTGCDIVMGNPFLGEFFTNYRYGIDIGSGHWDYVRTNFLWGVACFATHTGDLFVPNSDSIGLFPGLNDTDAAFALNYCVATRSAVEIAGKLSECDKSSPRYRMLRKAACNPNNGQELFLARFDYRSRPDPVPAIVYFKSAHFSPVTDSPSLPLRTVGLFNLEETDLRVTFSPADLGLPDGAYTLTDVWSGETVSFTGEAAYTLEPHGSRLLAVSRTEALQLLDADVRISAACGNTFTIAYAGEWELILNRPVTSLTVDDVPVTFTCKAAGNHYRVLVKCAAGVMRVN